MPREEIEHDGARTIEVHPDLDRVARRTAGYIVRVAEEAIAERGRFTIALSGGSAPPPVYALLAREPLRSRIDWSRVEVYWGDERCVPPTHERSNFRMAHEALLAHVPVRPEHVHRIRVEDDPAAAAESYETLLRDRFAGGGRRVPPAIFDVNLMGMGEDGHTASLFPGQPALAERSRWAVATLHGPTAQWRVTLTPPVLNSAHHVLVMVAGSSKARAVRDVLEGIGGPEERPARLLDPAWGALVWLLDDDAAARLSRRSGCARSA
ncbi:MAG TPA: 6-phosphogluconolactonase [Gemmatimonadaceae bacterium]|nr:6-phosphogluconolactonase [Gemmatimonadaceae bacterium]